MSLDSPPPFRLLPRMSVGKRIKEARVARGWSQGQLGERAGVSQTGISSWERGRTEPTRDDVRRVAAALGVEVGEIELGPDGGATDSVSVVGYVSAGAALVQFGAGQGPFETVPAPRFKTESTVAVEVRGTSLGPAFDQSVIFYDDVRSPVTPDLIGRLCVVALSDDRVLVKVLRQGENGRFHLLSNTAEEPIWNADVVWAARVTEVRPR